LSGGLAPGATPAGPVPKFTPYQRRLYLLLSVASFFDGYDSLALSQVLPELRQHFAIDAAQTGSIVAVINIGTVVAYLLVRRADQWGRRRLLNVTVLGYTLFTLASGLAPNVWAFAALQFFSKMFLIAEWAVSMVVAAEEFPKERRGYVIGMINAFSTLGGIVCGALVPVLTSSPFGWRTVYFVGVFPLLAIAYFRRNLQETQRYSTLAAADPSSVPAKRPLFHIWNTAYRTRMLQLGLIWGLVYIAANNVVTFFKDFAVNERGLSAAEVSRAIVLAAVVATPMVFFVGRMLDKIGRRWGATWVFCACTLGTLGCFTLRGTLPLTAAMTLAIFAAGAVLPVLNALNTELFPTDLRGDAMAWSNNLLGRIGYVISPAVIGLVGKQYGYGVAMSAAALFPLIAIPLVFRFFPETNQRELEETAAL
jgi:MFS transporter, putative metabolite:H+ symporter